MKPEQDCNFFPLYIDIIRKHQPIILVCHYINQALLKNLSRKNDLLEVASNLWLICNFTHSHTHTDSAVDALRLADACAGTDM